GILFRPRASSTLSVSNTVVAGISGDGISMVPSGSGDVNAILNRVEAYNNGHHGIIADGALSTGTLFVAVTDSVTAHNGGAGIISNTTNGLSTVSFFRSISSNNDSGVAAAGSEANLVVSQSMIFHNSRGWDASSGGFLISYSDNVSLNAVNDTPPL